MEARKWFTSLLLGSALLLLGAAVTSAQEAPAAPPRDGVSLTVYNSGSALVQDRRTFTFETGESVINFTDVASGIDATSVSFKSLTDPSGTIVLEQNYVYDLVDSSALLQKYIDEVIQVTMTDGTLYSGQLLSSSGDIILRLEGGEVVIVRLADARDIRFPTLPEGLITRPTLRWLVSSAQGSEQQVELKYLTYGMNWTADYTFLLARDNSALDVNGWVTLTNNSGAGYRDAQLKLVAGDVNRLPQPMATPTMMFDAMAAAPQEERRVEQREIFEYQLYEITRPVTIGSNEIKQIEFVTAAGVPATTFYVYDGSMPFYGYSYPMADQYGDTGITTVGTYLEFTTGEEDGLGADLPAGRVRVYQQDVDGSALLIGENSIDHTPMGEDIQLYLGNAFDLVGERKQTEFRRISDKVVQESFEIRLRNRKDDTPVTIRVPERLYRWSNWEILNASADYTRRDSATIEFRVEVPAGGETVLTYTVQYAFP